jgi:TonB family protein
MNCYDAATINRSAPMLSLHRSLALAAALALLSACGDSSAPQGAAPVSQGPSGAGQEPVEQILARANAALQAQQLFDPPESNAMSLFLQVIDREGSAESEGGIRRRLVDSAGGGDAQQRAQSALNDMFPDGLVRVEQVLRTGDLDNAGRILAMLERARPDAPSVQRLRDTYQSAVTSQRAALRSTDLESLPPLISKRLPTYPPRAERRGIEGWVHLSFVIQPDGSVDEVKVVAAEPERVFDREAVAALKLWRFEAPGRQISAQRRMDFSLKPSE